MVKNTKGGKGSKSLARKNCYEPPAHHQRIRLPEDELEKVALVTKFFGNMCHVVIPDYPEPLMCHIRGKFKGRFKKQSFISVGKLLLVGLRHFESSRENCDILDVYDTSVYNQLHQQHNLTPFLQYNLINHLIDTNDTIFTEEDEDEDEDTTIARKTPAAVDTTKEDEDAFINDI